MGLREALVVGPGLRPPPLHGRETPLAPLPGEMAPCRLEDLETMPRRGDRNRDGDRVMRRTQWDDTIDNNWVPPASEVAKAVQYPTTDPMFGERIVNAYARDAMRARDARRKSQ